MEYFNNFNFCIFNIQENCFSREKTVYMVNMNMCLVYGFSKLCNSIGMYDKLKDSSLVDLAYCYKKKNSALTILPYASI